MEDIIKVMFQKPLSKINFPKYEEKKLSVYTHEIQSKSEKQFSEHMKKKERSIKQMVQSQALAKKPCDKKQVVKVVQEFPKHNPEKIVKIDNDDLPRRKVVKPHKWPSKSSDMHGQNNVPTNQKNALLEGIFKEMKVTEVPGCRTVDKEKKSGNIQHFNQNNDYSSHLKNSCSTNREKNKEINFINCPSSEKGSHDVMLQSSQKSESETLFKENNKNQTLMNHNKELEKKGENKFSHVHNTEEMKKPVNVNTGKQKSSSLEPQTIIEINNISNSTIVSNTDTSSANGFTQKHTSPPNDENGSGLRRSKRRMSNQV